MTALDLPAAELDGRVLQVGKRRFRRLRRGLKASLLPFRAAVEALAGLVRTRYTPLPAWGLPLSAPGSRNPLSKAQRSLKTQQHAHRSAMASCRGEDRCASRFVNADGARLRASYGT